MIPKKLTSEERKNLKEEQREARHSNRMHHCRMTGINPYNHMHRTGVSQGRPTRIQLVELKPHQQFLRMGKKPRVKRFRVIKHF
jgi:hypothetical protein